MSRIAETTEWNGVSVLTGADSAVTDPSSESALTQLVQAGGNTSNTMSLLINSWQPKVALDTFMTMADGSVHATGADPKVGYLEKITIPTIHAGESVTLKGISVTATATLADTSMAGFYFNTTPAHTAQGQSGGLLANAFVKYDDPNLKFNDYTVTNETGYSFGPTAATNYMRNAGRTNAYKKANFENTISDNITRHTDFTYDGAIENQGAYGGGALFKGAAGSESRIDITHSAHATQVITELDFAIEAATAERAKYGAYLNRLQHAADNLTNISTNTSISLSRITDTDYAEETTELARSQIITQASTAMLAQANQSKQTVLALLR